MAGMYISEAQAQARAMMETVERAHPGALERLRFDSVAELSQWDELTVTIVEETPGTDGCSVAGTYQSDPPTLVVTKALSNRRSKFTALHELGHHLQQTDLDLGSTVFRYSAPDRFEEEACDAFAAQVLLPDDDLLQKIDARGPVAQDVVDLFTSFSSASREACCVWAARQLHGSGVVVLLDQTGAVLFTASRSFIPPAKGSDQSRADLISAALLNPGAGATRDDTRILYRNGSTSESLFGQARWFDDQYLVAIMVTDHAAWTPLALPRPGTKQTGASSWTCETCDDLFTITERCQQCTNPRCRSGHCGCDVARAANNRLCPGCFLQRHPSQFDGGSNVCRDCD
ncbi:ImmA/IrrE family metallo-endopeptidase [Rhodococcus qingshengii]|uniref:ImmA/IrrE family metallo-endopeptidase n=2 Tax=Rhodococcus TaxID=1827 RepID=UPI0030CE348D